MCTCRVRDNCYQMYLLVIINHFKLLCFLFISHYILIFKAELAIAGYIILLCIYYAIMEIIDYSDIKTAFAEKDHDLCNV